MTFYALGEIATSVAGFLTGLSLTLFAIWLSNI